MEIQKQRVRENDNRIECFHAVSDELTNGCFTAVSAGFSKLFENDLVRMDLVKRVMTNTSLAERVKQRVRKRSEGE